MPDDFMVNDWWESGGIAMAQFKLEMHAVLKTAQRLKDAGFVNVEERIVKIPIGSWPKDKKLKTVGLYACASLVDGLEGLSLAPLTRGKFFSKSGVTAQLLSCILRCDLLRSKLETC